jgi:uncharacterized Ntn-hydrolase superfamily protein
MTWSILARDPATGAIGAAVATKFFAVGALALHASGRVGAIATQALINPMYGITGLELLARGYAPATVAAMLMAPDQGRQTRQLHILGADGQVFQHTGADCVDWCGHVRGPDVSVAGNMLAGPSVVQATLEAWRASPHLPMAPRLLAALRAGEAEGGDKRGRQSAALRIVSADPYPDLDIRADDHPDPLAELDRLLAVSAERFAVFRRFLPGTADPSGTWDRAVINAAIEAAAGGKS